MILLDIFEQREPYQKAIDALEQRRIDQVREKIDIFKKSLAKATDDEQRRAIAGRLKELEQELVSYYSVKETQQPQRPPAKGLLKGKDLVTPQQRVAGATPTKPGVAGAVKDVVGGVKRWLKGEPDQGPTFEQLAPGGPGSSPRALGIANFQRIAKANAGFQPTVYFEFIRPEENFKLDQRGIDLISDYYDGLANDQAKNYFIYRILPSGDETLKVLKQLGWTPPTPVQPELPGIPDPIQGELPLNEKKKSLDPDDIEAGDVKVARELQKLRAQYPGARSDVEAVARAEIDSSERSQQQLAAIRGANEKQDALLKQLVALDREQGREINSLDTELERVQATNNKLQQTIGQMTGTKKSVKTDVAKPKGIDLIPSAPVDAKPQAATPQPEPEPEPAPAPVSRKTTSPAIAAMAKQIQGLDKPAPTIRSIGAANEPQAQAVAEHGGGIGPRQHWQSLMREGRMKQALSDYKSSSDSEFLKKFGISKRDFYNSVINAKPKSKYKAPATCPQCGKQHERCVCESEQQLIEGIKDTASATAVIACLLTGGSLQGCATAPQQTTAQQVLKTGQDVGRTVQSAKKITRAGVEDEVQQEIRNVMRGISRPEELNNSNILRIWKRIKGQPPVSPEPQAPEYGPAEPVRRPATEAKEIKTRDDFLDARAHLLRKIEMDPNPVNKQILRAEIRKLESRAEAEGWLTMQQRLVREDTAALAAEDAILKRIFVRHKDLMMEYGPEKITQAAEEVSYNVGDIAHISDDQISEWVKQVEYILGARP